MTRFFVPTKTSKTRRLDDIVVERARAEAPPRPGLLSSRPMEPTCAACGQPLRFTSPVWCADCRTPHHRDCFSRRGSCAAPRCQGRRYAESRIGPGVTAIERRAPDGTPALQSFVVDFTSHRELAANAAIWLSAGATLAGALGGTAHPLLALGGAACLFTAILVRRQLADYRVIAAADHMIWLHSSFLGRAHLTREAAFTEVQRVVLAWDQYGGRRRWTVWLHLLNDRALCLTDTTHQFADPRLPAAAPPELADVARAIAELIGVKVAVEENWRAT